MFFKKHKEMKYSDTTPDYFKFMEDYREELQSHELSIQSFSELVKKHGLKNLLMEHILQEKGIGDGICMCGFCFPNIWQPWEKDNNPNYFESGVRFSFTIDGWSEVISYQEFIWLIEDTCKIYLKQYPNDINQINDLLERVREKYLNTKN